MTAEKRLERKVADGTATPDDIYNLFWLKWAAA